MSNAPETAAEERPEGRLARRNAELEGAKAYWREVFAGSKPGSLLIASQQLCQAEQLCTAAVAMEGHSPFDTSLPPTWDTLRELRQSFGTAVTAYHAYVCTREWSTERSDAASTLQSASHAYLFAIEQEQARIGQVAATGEERTVTPSAEAPQPAPKAEWVPNLVSPRLEALRAKVQRQGELATLLLLNLEMQRVLHSTASAEFNRLMREYKDALGEAAEEA